MLLKRYLLFVTLSFLCIGSYSQDIKVYQSYDEFGHLLENKNDTTYVINFWATWCKPCVKEIPDFLEINKKFKQQKFKMILVSLDFETQLNTKVKPYIKKNNVDAEVVLLTDPKQHNWIDKVNTDWSGSIPMTIIYNKNFYLFKEGSLSFEELNEIITKNIIK